MDAPITPRCAVLLLLHSHGPQSGGSLFSLAWRLTDGRVRLRDGSIYPLLKRMKADGLVVECAEKSAPGSKGGRPGHLVALTRAGRKAAQKEARLLKALMTRPQQPTPTSSVSAESPAKTEG